jgi:hypothetical protein
MVVSSNNNARFVGVRQYFCEIQTSNDSSSYIVPYAYLRVIMYGSRQTPTPGCSWCNQINRGHASPCQTEVSDLWAKNVSTVRWTVYVYLYDIKLATIARSHIFATEQPQHCICLLIRQNNRNTAIVIRVEQPNFIKLKSLHHRQCHVVTSSEVWTVSPSLALMKSLVMTYEDVSPPHSWREDRHRQRSVTLHITLTNKEQDGRQGYVPCP